MRTFIVLIDFTEKGVSEIRETAKRASDFTAAAEKAGVKVKDVYWTLGSHDGVLVLQSDDDLKMASLLLDLSGRGYVRTETLRALDRAELNTALSRS